MSVKFFGQFLIEQGEIDAGQLREALERMQTSNLTLGVRGAQRLELGLAADGAVASALAGGISGVARESLDDSLLADGLGEFLNVLVGNAVAALDREGVAAQLEPVRHSVLPPLDHVFDLIATSGRGALVARVSTPG